MIQNVEQIISARQSGQCKKQESPSLSGAPSDTRLSLLQSAWLDTVRRTWQIDPAITIHLAERFTSPILRAEVVKLVRSSTQDVLSTPEALPFLLGDRLDPHFRRDLKVWVSVYPGNFI
jgi:phosphatidylinositol 4-kinase A